MKPGDEMVFRSPYDQYKHLNEKRCVVLEERNHGTHPDMYDEEVGSLFLINLEGQEIEAWPEELHLT